MRRCAHELSPNATVVVTDADVLVNGRDRASLLDSLEAHADRLARGDVVFSAEGPCVTVNKHYRRPLCDLFTARHARQSGESPLQP